MLTWSNNYSVRAPLLVLASVEALILYSSVYFAGLVLCGDLMQCEAVLGPLAPRAATVAGVMLVSLVSMGLYHFRQRVYFHEVLIRVAVGIVIGSAALAAFYYVFPAVSVSRELAAIAILYALSLLLLCRFYFVKNVDENIFRRRTLIYGAGDRAAGISDLRRSADRRGFVIVGKVPAPGDTHDGNKNVFTTNGHSITELAVEKGADEIVVAMDDRRGNLPVQDLLDARLRGINVVDLLEFLERETGKIRIDLVNPGWLIFSPGFRTSRVRRFSKRVMDIMVSGGLLLVSWPIMILIAIAIKIENGVTAPVLYRQCRVGRGNELFSALKFRSMTVDAEPDGKAVWAAKDDDRITRVGRLLRKGRLDELPQFFNVLRGQMSLVGPRPERPEFVESLRETVQYYSERHTVKPGVTGWAQLRYAYGSSVEDAIEKLQYDLYYIKNQSLMLDLIIILQTVEVVLWGKGAR